MEEKPARPFAKLDPLQLRTKIIVSLVGVFLVFVASRGGLLWWEHEQILADEQRRTENLSHVLAEHLNRTFGAIESALNQLAVHSDRIGGPQAPREVWSQVLEATLSGLSGIGSLNVLDADGFVVLSTNPAVTGTSRRSHYLLNRLKEDPSTELVIGPAAPAEHISGVRIPVGRALRDRDGRFIGLLAATFQPERLRGFYEAIDIGPRGIIQVLHPDGHLLFRQPHSSRLSGKSIGNQSILSAWRGGSAHGFVRAAVDAGGLSYLTAWRTLSRPPLIVSMSVPEDDALSRWQTDLVTVASSAGVTALLLAFAGIWIMASSRAYARTLAERDFADAALQRNQVQFQAIMDHSPSGIVLKDLEGRYLLASSKIQEWFGLPVSSIIGRTTSELFDAEAHGVDDQDGSVAKTGEVFVSEGDVNFRDGVSRRMVITKFPVRFADGATVCIGGILTDVTAVRDTENKLRQAQKMDALGSLTGGIAHDFNNLLTAVMGNLEMLQDYIGGNEQAGHHLKTATAAARRGADLNHRLLSFARLQPMRPAATDINRLITDCIVLFRRTLGAGIEIEFSPAKDTWAALIDRNELENALLNLAINARDAMPDGGNLSIETANATLDEDYAARNAEVAAGAYVMVAVSDTGTGMPPEVLERVFEPFFTTKPQGKGTGLGLSMVYGFAKQSGGHVRIYSEVGAGTTVRLYLPRASGREAATAERETGAPETPPRGSETVLVVEDDPDVREFVSSALKSLGYAVSQAPDGPSALLVLDEIPRLDLLITDVVLPHGMNGREVAEKVRASRPATKVIFTSGFAESIIVHQGRLEEGVDFLAKPFAKNVLARRVRSSLDSPFVGGLPH